MQHNLSVSHTVMFRRFLFLSVILFSTAALISSCSDRDSDDTVVVYTYKVIKVYPHDPRAFTQGLVFADGLLYEGTGRKGHSTLRKVEPETGEVLQMHKLGDEYFGEGITVFGDRIIQLTLDSNLGFVYDRQTFELLKTFNYPTKGWGLTHDGARLIMSDGSATLYLLDAETLTQIGRIEVRRGDVAIAGLNELEYIRGKIYANIWPTEQIAIISPDTGQVTGWVDLSGLLGPEEQLRSVDVANGIAYDSATDRLFVTGKLWPKLFEIKLAAKK